MARPRPTRAPPARRRGPGLVGSVLILIVVAGLCALGKWQLDRRVWKERLLARIAALQTAPPEPLNVVFNRLADGGETDFVRVVARCDRIGDKSVHLYGLRAAGPGWRQITACALPAPGPYGSLLVDLGFQAEAGGDAQMPTPIDEPLDDLKDRALEGVLRAPEPKAWYASFVTPAPSRRNGSAQFFERDIPGMASALDAPRPAPVMLTLERPAASPKLIASPLPTDIPNNHLGYAVTWFGLALALVAVWLTSLIRARRPAR